MRIASVIVDVSARALDRAFDYLVPQELEPVRVGCAVSVDFAHRPVVGYVVALRDVNPSDSLDKTKPLAGILSEPYFDEIGAKLAQWISREYAAPLSESLKLLTPPGGAPKIKRVDDQWTLVRQGVGRVDDRWVFLEEGAEDIKLPATASKQKKIVQALSCGGMRMAELSLEVGGASQACAALARKGAIRIEERRRIRTAMETVQSSSESLRDLTPGQAHALDTIVGSMEAAAAGSSQENVVVVDGITGSGKTEVYLRAIQKCLDMGKTACVLVPEIALTPQTVGRFRSRFGQNVAVLHSRLSTGERFDQWDMVREGQARVVVGTRSALFAPLKNLGLLVIDEEHENTYKQDSSPRYDARNVALELCRLRGAALVLGSATPSIQTLSHCSPSEEKGAWKHVVLDQRPSGQELPDVKVVDMAKEFGGGHRSMFSRELTDALIQTFEAGEKSILLLNKRGFASFVLCRECGFVPECPECSVSLTYHEVGNVLVCHHCGHSEPMPPKCPHCGSPYLRKFGAGTQRVEDELRAVMPQEASIIRMDADTTSTKGAHEALLDEFSSTDRAILLGTQMIAKGLDFPDVTLVGVINADTTLKLPDYKSPERTFQLLEQVSGRAGRADKPGRVIVQTYCPEHPAIMAAAAHDRSILLDEEIPAREELGYPPFKRLANILIWGKNEQGVRLSATEIALALNSTIISENLNWTVLGPAPCILSRIKGDTRWHILVKAEPDDHLGSIIGPILAKRKKHDGVKATVDIDPGNLL